VSAWLSIVIPTAGSRPDGLLRTLDSIHFQSGAAAIEVLVVADTNALDDRGHFDLLRAAYARYGRAWRWLEHDGGLHCYGQPQRSFGARQASGEWVAFSQDDNILAPHALSSIWLAVCQEPRPRPLFFRTLTFWGELVWRERTLELGNIDADCLVLPREVAAQVTWGLRYEGDFDAASDAARLSGGDVGWREETIAIARPESVWW